MINADEIAGILKQQIETFQDAACKKTRVGTVIEVGANLARVYGLRGVRSSELVEFADGMQGVALNLEEDNVGVVILGPDKDIKEGDKVRRTGRIASVPVGEALLGRVVNPLGQPIDGKGPIETNRYRTIENVAPGRRAAPRRQAAAADRYPRDRRADSDRQGPARADHRRPFDRQDRHRHRHDHQSKGRERFLRLRRDRSEELDRRRAVASARAKGRDGLHDHRRRQPVRSRRVTLAGAVRRVRDGRRVDVRRQRRADRIRRSHQARAVVSRNVVVAAPPAGSRSLPGRRFLSCIRGSWNAPANCPTNSAAAR